MKAGHATLRTNTALSDFLSGKRCRITLLRFTVHKDTSHSVNTAFYTSNHLSLQMPDCQHSFVLSRHVSVCRYCTCVCLCEYNIQIIPPSSPSTLISSSVSLTRGLDLCEFSFPSLSLCSSSWHLLNGFVH